MTKNKMEEKADKPAKVEKTEKSAVKAEKAEKHHESHKQHVSFKTRLESWKEYFDLSRVELRKVSWPNWKETRNTSLVVFGFVIVMALLLSLVDLGLSTLMRLILS